MSTTGTSIDIAARIAAWGDDFRPHLEHAVADEPRVPEALRGAVRHSLLAPGKRLRPYLVERCYRVCGGTGDDIFPVAAAVECVHVFTLIHDDLPAMDNAALRRGLPSNHVVYGDAVAILAGDALLALGFERVASSAFDAAARVEMVRELAAAIGWAGVIGGQAIDVASEQAPPDLRLTATIHRLKTARLFECCCRLGATAAGAEGRLRQRLGDFGMHLGLAFQIADDILDVCASAAETGKHAGGDARHAKQTYPRAIGLEASRHQGTDAAERAVAALEGLASPAEELRLLAGYVMSRTH